MQDIELESIPEFKELQTHKQREFVRKYLTDAKRDPKKAYAMAGYNPKSADPSAYRLLGNDRIKAIIEYVDKQAVSVTVSVDDVVRVWRRALFADDISWSDRLKASELVAKYRKMFDDNDLRQPIFQIFTNQDLSALGLQSMTQGKVECKANSQVIDIKQDK